MNIYFLKSKWYSKYEMVKIIKQNFAKNKKLFNIFARKLEKIIGEDVPINHVGSTAIPNMFGKNIIDILIGAKEEIKFQEIVKKLIGIGFFASNKKDEIYQFLSSAKEETGAGDIHIHLVILDTEKYNDFLILKNYLLNDKKECLAYSNYKKEIISKGVTDRREYKKIKSEYVTKLLERAKKIWL